jgi:FkbM family methyltransferase
MHRLTSVPLSPIIFDIGANIGQSVRRFRRYFNDSVIHSFEPGEEAFQALTKNTLGLDRVHISNRALGAACTTRTFVENELSDMSSLFEPGESAWGSIVRRRKVELDTVDDYCNRNGIERIDILKSDTQGYDLEVLRGARQCLKDQRVELIYLELTFSKMYKGAPRFDEIYAFLADHGMVLVSFYDMYYQGDFLSWTDALFRLDHRSSSCPVESVMCGCKIPSTQDPYPRSALVKQLSRYKHD